MRHRVFMICFTNILRLNSVYTIYIFFSVNAITLFYSINMSVTSVAGEGRNGGSFFTLEGEGEGEGKVVLLTLTLTPTLTPSPFCTQLQN
jgi:hypothetical protein